MAPVRCQLAKVVMSEQYDRQIIVLEEQDGSRKFPIIIGPFEVSAIHRTVNDEPPPRPMTHELIGSIMETMDISIEKVIVNDLHDMTFYARLFLKQGEETYEIDSRPSDAIALALQKEAPIFVEEKVIDTASD